MSRVATRICIAAVITVLHPSTSRAQGGRRPSRPAPAPAAAAAPTDTVTFSQLRYRYIGPVGNRVATVAGVVGDPATYYAGAASGGIWKTTDGGIHWQPIFDDQPVQSIGALAVAPSDPNVVWAGTGEAWIRSHISIGNGMYKSTDAGKTWQHLGLDLTGRIARVVIHPTNPDIVFAAALGHSYGPQQERGIYRTTDGGKTWERVLFVDENTGAADVVMDPNNPRILFAAMWQLVIHTWGRESGGPGSGIYVSKDGGTTWKKLTGNGLPVKPFGKVGLAMSRSNSSRIYALIETGDGVPWHGQETERGELWRSDDGGETWRVVSYDRQLSCRQPYYTRVAVAPDRDNEAYFLCASFTKTLDGGATTTDVPFPQSPGGDNHDMWIDPTDGNRMIVGNDGQVAISTNRGGSWDRVQLPIAQMYHVTVDNQVPYYVMGNRQDGPSSRGPSNSKVGGFGGGGGGGGAGIIPRGEWHSVGGGESGWATPDPTDPNLIWSSASGSGSVGGIVVRYDERTRQAQNVEIWPQSTIGFPAADVKYRFVWTMPLTISPHDHHRIYAGSQFVHMTTDGGKSWQVISPDLTLNDKSKQQISGGLTPDNIGVEYGDVVFAIAESPLKAGLLWAGTNDGVVQVTRDGGKNWTNVT
ncbi:MAG: sialidase, partial [Gemmatimonadetes bacterium]